VEQNKMMEGQTTNTLEALKYELISAVQNLKKKNIDKGNLTDLSVMMSSFGLVPP
jgi:hypothetical protein